MKIPSSISPATPGRAGSCMMSSIEFCGISDLQMRTDRLRDDVGKNTGQVQSKRDRVGMIIGESA